MNRNDYLRLLQQHDDPVHWEVPGGWESYDYKKAFASFQLFAKEIEITFEEKCKVEYGSTIQDASFIGQVFLPVRCSESQSSYVCLRISYFGNFSAARVIHSEEKSLPSCEDLIKKVSQEHGYIFIPMEVLHEPYTGKLHLIEPTWWNRFFDYM